MKVGNVTFEAHLYIFIYMNLLRFYFPGLFFASYAYKVLYYTISVLSFFILTICKSI
jgi:hypothetical protein